MPAYAILRTQTVRGQNSYKVILKADDGYTETHEYSGNIATLEAATRGFNASRIAFVTRGPDSDHPPVFVEVI